MQATGGRQSVASCLANDHLRNKRAESARQTRQCERQVGRNGCPAVCMQSLGQTVHLWPGSRAADCHALLHRPENIMPQACLACIALVKFILGLCAPILIKASDQARVYK